MSIILLLLMLFGCTLGPNYVRPEISFIEHKDKPSIPPTPWWKNIKDPTLHNLIEKGLEGNLDLEAALSRIQQAQARLGIHSSNLSPHSSTHASISKNSASTKGIYGNNPFLIRNYDLYKISAHMTWELDIFGRLQRTREAANAFLNTETLNYYATAVCLAATVAREYVLFRSLQTQITLHSAIQHVREKSVDLSKKQANAGIRSKSYQLEESIKLQEHKALLPFLEQQLAETGYRLDALTAQPAGTSFKALHKANPIPLPIIHLDKGIPSELLQKRPDILIAEQRLIAANALIGAAQAEYFPKFSLIGSIGFEARKSTQLLDTKARFFSTGPTLSWRILDFWRIDDEIQEAKGAYKEELAHYKHIVLKALCSVESALVTYEKNLLSLKQYKKKKTLQKQQLAYTQDRYTSGLTSLIDVMHKKEALHQVDIMLTQAQQKVLNAYITLAESLGGHMCPMK